MSLKLGVVGTCALSGSLDTVGTLNGETHLVCSAIVGELDGIRCCASIFLGSHREDGHTKQGDKCQQAFFETFCRHKFSWSILLI